MLLSQLSDSWAGTYLQVTIAVLVFGLGLPALASQLLIAEDLRHVLRRRLRPLGWGAVPVLFSAIVALCLIWILHDYRRTAWQSPLLRFGASLVAPYAHWIANILLSMLIVMAASLLLMLTVINRERYLGHLAKICKRQLKRRGVLDGTALADIGFLGERGDAGLPKQYALAVLDRLADHVQGHAQYHGEELTDVLLAIEATLRLGDERNFQDATMILKRIVERLTARRDCWASPDMEATLRISSRIGVMALQHGFEQAALGQLGVSAAVGPALKAAFPSVMRFLFELGAEALNRHAYGVAVGALSQMEFGIQGAQPVAPEKAADYLGLVAEFWAAGKNARNRARLSLDITNLRPFLRQYLMAARLYHAALARLDTADKVDTMRSEACAPGANLARKLSSLLGLGQATAR